MVDERFSRAPSYKLLFGPLALALLVLGTVGLALIVPGYSQVRQTVSEIGELGSPARIPFAILLCGVGACLLVFAAGVREVSTAAGRFPLAAYLIGFEALSAAGAGIFAYPHPLHGVFGLSQLIGYQAPWVLAFTWRGQLRLKPVVTFSWIMAGSLWISIILNLSSLDRHGALAVSMQSFYGLVQRSLFALWFGWCAGLGVLLFRRNE